MFPNSTPNWVLNPNTGTDAAFGALNVINSPAPAYYPNSTNGEVRINSGQTPGYSSAGTSSGGLAVSSPPVNQALLSQYDQGIDNVQSGINRLPGTLNSLLSGIDASGQNALNVLLQGKNTGERNYNQSKQTAATDYVGAKNTIGSQAGSTLSGLLRLLGSRGAGGGSAYNIAAPQAVARGASLQRADAGNIFGQNQQALDTNWGDFLQGYNNSVLDVNNQTSSGKLKVQQQVDANRATLLQTLAQLQAQRAEAAGGNGVTAAQPYLDQANQILDKASNYTTAPIKYNTQAYQAPSLASYNPQAPATPQYNGSGPVDYFSPYLQALLGKRQQPGIA